MFRIQAETGSILGESRLRWVIFGEFEAEG
jgi:hypothetical protein